ncbi:hypothetical protein [Streptomyces sp.]|uniref:hypothetical protein n=1 Tax=Streptomyces sp. TaxID=1931 RepID=UPI002F426876
MTTPAREPLPAYQPASRTDALLHAELTGADGVYGGDWHQALRDAAAQWAAEGALARLQAGLLPAGTNPAPHTA